jgi:capsule polysaccharide export protein KpsE/RkpR
MTENTNEFGSTFTARVIRAAARNAGRIAVFCFLAALGSSIYSLAVRKQWASWAVLMVPGQQSSTLGLGNLMNNIDLSGFGGGMLENLIPGQTQGGTDITVVQQVLGSRPVLERIILEYDLIARLKASNMERTLEKFEKRLTVTLTPEGLLFVSIRAESRQESAAMVQDLIDYSNQELSRMVTSRARRARIQAERSLAIASDSLAAANSRLEDFRRETGFLIPEQGVEMVAMLSEMQQEMVLAGSELSSVSSGISARSSSWARASAKYEYLLEAVNQSVTGEGEGLSVFPPLDSLPGYLREYEDLFLEVETRRMVYILLRQELENLRIEEAKESPTVEVLVPPTPAHERAFPRRTTMVLMVTVLAFVLALAWIVTLEWFRAVMSGSTGAFWRETWRTVRNQFPGRPRGRS